MMSGTEEDVVVCEKFEFEDRIEWVYRVRLWKSKILQHQLMSIKVGGRTRDVHRGPGTSARGTETASQRK